MPGRGAVYVAAVEVVAVRTRRADRQRRGSRHLGGGDRRGRTTRSGIMRSRGQRTYLLPRAPAATRMTTSRQQAPQQTAPQVLRMDKSTHPHTGPTPEYKLRKRRRKRETKNNREISKHPRGTGGRRRERHEDSLRDCAHCERNRSSRRRPPQEQRASGRDVTSPQVMRRADDGASALRPSRGGIPNYDGPFQCLGDLRGCTTDHGAQP